MSGEFVQIEHKLTGPQLVEYGSYHGMVARNYAC